MWEPEHPFRQHLHQRWVLGCCSRSLKPVIEVRPRGGCGPVKAASPAHPAAPSRELSRVKARHRAGDICPKHPAKPGLRRLHAGQLSAADRVLHGRQSQPVARIVQTTCKHGQAGVLELCNAQPGASRLTHTLGNGSSCLQPGARTSPDGRRIRLPLRKAPGCVEDARREQTCSGPELPPARPAQPDRCRWPRDGSSPPFARTQWDVQRRAPAEPAGRRPGGLVPCSGPRADGSLPSPVPPAGCSLPTPLVQRGAK